MFGFILADFHGDNVLGNCIFNLGFMSSGDDKPKIAWTSNPIICECSFSKRLYQYTGNGQLSTSHKMKDYIERHYNNRKFTNTENLITIHTMKG